jgi:anti-sigma factor RsiW
MNACHSVASALDDAALGAPASRALATHLVTCAACAAHLERRRALAQRIDRMVGDIVRAEPPAGFAERVAARRSAAQPRRWSRVWLIAPAGLALAAALLIFVTTIGGVRGTPPVASVAAISTWRSPTASLLVSRSSVLGTPFTLRDVRDGAGRSRS